MSRPLPQATLFALSAALVAAGPLWSSLVLGRREARSHAAADGALARIASQEREWRTAHGRYAPFGPAAAEREAALPGLALDPGAQDFVFDAAPDPADDAGALRVRAVSRPEAIRAGRVVPLLSVTVLAAHPETGHEEGSSGAPGPDPTAR